jgi:membrane-associated phospholipid phosphatase
MTDKGGPPKIKAPPIEPPARPDKRSVTELAIGFLLALVAMVAFAFLADAIRLQEKFALDAYANPFLHAISSPALDVVMNVFTTIGDVPFVSIAFVIAMGFLLYRRLRAEALFLATAILGSVALNGILKVFIQRPRPPLPWAHVLPDYSFPSGHSMNSLVFYLAIAVIIWARSKAPAGSIAVITALLIATAVGFSRIYLGYHYLSDVVGGFAAGLAWLLVVALSFEAIPRSWAHRPWAHRATKKKS